ncbi:MAG: metallophosphoesterase [Gemmataceae bacterium]
MVDLLRDLSDPLPVWLLWLGAVIGHGFLMTTALNVLYAWPLPHRLLRFTRKIDILIVLAGPVLFLIAVAPWGQAGLDWYGSGVRFYLAPYTVFCCVFGLIVAPLAQIGYWLRRTAPQLIAEQAEVVDVARVLGTPPAGRGKHFKLTTLPGNQVFQVEFRNLTLQMPQLPAAWEGLSILHLTDLHFRGTPDRAFYQYVVEKSMAAGTPDIVAITGDVVDSSWHHRWIVPILGRLRWNLAGYAILGNHDSWRDTQVIRRRLSRLGLQVLGNGWRALDVRGERMLVVGQECPWFKPAPDPSAWPEAAFKLCLSHTPDNIPWAKKHGIDLMLAGHVHGGQIRLPLIGSVFCPSRFSRRYDCGTFFEAPTLMHVSRGLAGQHPLRFRCRPEVTRIVLTRK